MQPRASFASTVDFGSDEADHDEATYPSLCAGAGGWMAKRGAWVKAWRRRFFTVDTATTGLPRLLYFSKRAHATQPAKAKGAVPLDGTLVTRFDFTAHKRAHCFGLTPAGGGARTYVLACTSSSERRAWWMFLVKNGAKLGPGATLIDGDRDEDEDALTALVQSSAGLPDVQAGVGDPPEREQEQAEEQAVLREGFLLKRGDDVLKISWKIRYFVLTAESLTYYKTRGGGEAKGVVDLSRGFDVQLETARDVGYDHAFGVLPAGGGRRKYILVAANVPELELWVTALRSLQHSAASACAATSAVAAAASESSELDHDLGTIGMLKQKRKVHRESVILQQAAAVDAGAGTGTGDGSTVTGADADAGGSEQVEEEEQKDADEEEEEEEDDDDEEESEEVHAEMVVEELSDMIPVGRERQESVLDLQARMLSAVDGNLEAFNSFKMASIALAQGRLSAARYLKLFFQTFPVDHAFDMCEDLIRAVPNSDRRAELRRLFKLLLQRIEQSKSTAVPKEEDNNDVEVDEDDDDDEDEEGDEEEDVMDERDLNEELRERQMKAIQLVRERQEFHEAVQTTRRRAESRVSKGVSFWVQDCQGNVCRMLNTLHLVLPEDVDEGYISVADDAALPEVRKAFLRASKIVHPDRQRNASASSNEDTAEKMLRCEHIFASLKEQYDRFEKSRKKEEQQQQQPNE